MSTKNSQTPKTSQSPKKQKVLALKAGLQQSDMEAFEVQETCSEAEENEISKETEKALKQAAKNVVKENKNEVSLRARKVYDNSIKHLQESFGGKAWVDGSDHSDSEEEKSDHLDEDDDIDEKEQHEDHLEDEDDLDVQEEVQNNIGDDTKIVDMKKKDVIEEKNEKIADGSKKIIVKDEMVDEEKEEMEKMKKERKLKKHDEEKKESKKRKREVKESKEMKKKEKKEQKMKENKKKNGESSSKKKDVSSLKEKVEVLDIMNEVGMKLGACCQNTVLNEKNKEKMKEILNDYAKLMLYSKNVQIPDKICDLMRECYDFAGSRSDLRYLNRDNFEQAATLFNDVLSDKIALFEKELEKN